MEEVITITESPIEKAPLRSSESAADEDKEMIECLARLKVWRIENLMSPAGMDRFR